MILYKKVSISHTGSTYFFRHSKISRGRGDPPKFLGGQILTSFFTTRGYPPNLLGVSANKNSYLKIQVEKRLNNNNRRQQMAINGFIISTLNVSDDIFFSIDTYKSSDKLHIIIKLGDTHPTCPCCGGYTKNEVNVQNK